MSGEPDAYPVAYCAPGERFAAALALMLRGEQVARIVEHLWLEGAEGVYVAAEDPMDLIKRLPARCEFPEPEPPSWRDPNWAYGALMNAPSTGLHSAIPISPA